MVSPGEMVRTISNVLAMPEPTSTQVDRALSVAGLRTKAGRGKSAAKVTPADAARLVVAIAGGGLPSSGPLTDAARVVKAYEATRAEAPRNDFGPTDIPALVNLPSNHSIVDAIAALIEAAADGSLVEALWANCRQVVPDGYGLWQMLDDLSPAKCPPTSGPLAGLDIGGITWEDIAVSALLGPGITATAIPAVCDISIESPDTSARIKFRGIGTNVTVEYVYRGDLGLARMVEGGANGFEENLKDCGHRMVAALGGGVFGDLKQERRITLKTIRVLGYLFAA